MVFIFLMRSVVGGPKVRKKRENTKKSEIFSEHSENSENSEHSELSEDSERSEHSELSEPPPPQKTVDNAVDNAVNNLPFIHTGRPGAGYPQTYSTIIPHFSTGFAWIKK